MPTTATVQGPDTHGWVSPQQTIYRSRVRSGCLTCRSRKVKCDELRPQCANCTRLKRQCVYNAKTRHSDHPTIQNQIGSRSIDASQTTASTSALAPSLSIEHPRHVFAKAQPYPEDGTQVFPITIEDRFRSPDESIVQVTNRLIDVLRGQSQTSALTSDDVEGEADLPSVLISRDIKLTTTMDILTAREVPLQPLFSIFLDSVECHVLTPFDNVNWQRMKHHVVEMGLANRTVALAIISVSALYKAQLYNLPLSKAISLYHDARSAFDHQVEHGDPQDFPATLVVAFLLSLFSFFHYEEVCLLKEPSEAFLEQLRTWPQHHHCLGELPMRLMLWLRILQVTTLRGGGMGMISEQVLGLFPTFKPGQPNLKPDPKHQSNTATHLYEMLSGPIFEFYLQLQEISGEIAQLTHYHRSRTTGADQDEVSQQITLLTSKLQNLWDTRSVTQCQTPKDLLANLSPTIAEPLVALIGLCTAAYHAEFIEMTRLIGDPVAEPTGSKEGMREIRNLIDGENSNAAHDKHGQLRAGYLRPLFLYAIECMDADKSDWAVQKLRDIHNPICRSDFFAAFAKALSDAQLRKERRVTSKYFCIWFFGVPPPFL
ncbi:uncharacterized protein A1O9_03240 [Exophiala aquamarina CBS 119918]|uniref:Zn(2)-C6 fungal-type domain-containing protein n=1 Tax=Exophiala aquamarina CBS 119918 TaxID=1182545 RepID=A0A072PPK1_9EURO|nr:uncharacterized protein A1O9_03240 [Exophiala aquamarina CBS 119918]KEF61672.1 hypothetical protein A1O9_03240 [Exophiala aquamarina CBS 119918]